MNLADIRKKAREGKGASVAPPPAVAEVPGQGNAETVTPESRETPEFVFDDIIPAEPVAAVRRDDVPAEVPVRHGFDPLALLLAGRENGGGEEEMPLATTVRPEHGGGEFQELLCFRVADEKYAVSIMDLKEIIKPREVTEVPRVPGFVSGILSLRGIIIPIFDLRKRLGLEKGVETGRERVIVVKKGGEFCGLLVDEVIQVVRIVAATIEQPPAVLDGIDRDFVSGIGRFDKQMLILLNLEKILDVTLF